MQVSAYPRGRFQAALRRFGLYLLAGRVATGETLTQQTANTVDGTRTRFRGCVPASLMLRLLALILLTLLLGCRSSPTVAPYFYGTFVGYYLISPKAVPTGMRVETKLLDTEQKRYTFSGTAVLGTESYTLEGYEATASEVSLSTQAVPPPQGELVATLKDAGGATLYVLCSSVTYGRGERHREPHNYLLYEGSVAPERCADENPFATVQLQKG